MSKVCLALAVLLTGLPASAAPPKEMPRGKEVDEAVRRALAYLEANQNTDGSWPAPRNARPAVTALAVMAFLSAGHVPGEGPYAKNVAKGIAFIR